MSKDDSYVVKLKADLTQWLERNAMPRSAARPLADIYREECMHDRQRESEECS